MEKESVLVQVLHPSSSDGLLCWPSLLLHRSDLSWLKSRGFYLDYDGVMLVEYIYDVNSSVYRRSAFCKIENGTYVDIDL